MSSADESRIGLFPLGLVLLPGEVVPLHIFEPRYRLLIAERLHGGEFGVVLAGDSSVREHGCTARVLEVVERFDDGSLDIRVQGARRFRLLELVPPEDLQAVYLSGLVEYYDDDEPEAPAELRAGVLEWFRRVLSIMDVEMPREPHGEGRLSFRVAAAVDLVAEARQQLLESRSEPERLRTLLSLLESLLPDLELRKEREEAIRGNGKGH